MGRRTRTAIGTTAALVLLALAGCGDDDDDGGANPSNPAPGPTSDTGEPPVANVDHWHAAYGLYVCGEFLPNLPEFESPGGVHTHGDGVVHIHPFTEDRAGRNATLANFLSDGGVTLTEDQLQFGEQTLAEGESDCDGEDAQLVVATWQDAQCGSDEDGTLVTEDFDDIRFEQDGGGYTIAFVPEGTDLPKPESAAALAELGALDSGERLDDDPCG